MVAKPSTAVTEITVAEFVANSPAELALEVVEGHEFLSERYISSDRLQKIGLALSGYSDYLRPGRIKMIGNSETSYLAQMPEVEQALCLSLIDPEIVPCFLVTIGLSVPEQLAMYARKNRVPILRTSLMSSKASDEVIVYLQVELAPQTSIHAVLMGMHGIGVLLIGDSGIGKSECALDLITRGHRLISDDSVIIKRIGQRLIGDSPEITRGHLEIRGLGIISVSDLFGISALDSKTEIKLYIELNEWNSVDNIERLGLDIRQKELFGVSIPSFVLPVSPARNISTLVETAVKMFLLRRRGVDTSHRLIERHNLLVSTGADNIQNG